MKTVTIFSRSSRTPLRVTHGEVACVLGDDEACIEGSWWPDYRLDIRADDLGDELLVAVPAAPAAPEGMQTTYSVEAEQWVIEPTLETLRAQRWAALRTQRDALEVAPLLIDGRTWDVDERAVARIGLALKEAELTPGWSELWTLADDSICTVTAPVLMRVLLALAARGRRLHRAGRALRQRLAEATTAADIEAVTWPEEVPDADA